ncbi:signal recognition particle-docking protein FtsY [Acidithiobacillus sulfurivorans]|uniref:Signal recognition particle receptor FtsY n=1 Tax=Acidithiobacillus sulfurivorans TaxID=1958756 RepID=A0ABS5ZUU5_9PROT|nr:signal recognition particle-docking protein FtsY [Acidithiobacillus sulfurivorans]
MVFNWFKRNKSPSQEEMTEAADATVQSEPAEEKPETALPAHVEAVPEAESEEEASPPPEPAANSVQKGLFTRLREGLNRSREQFTEGVGRLVLGKKVIDDELLEDLEALLLQADLGSAATQEIMASVTEKVRRKELTDPAILKKALRDALLDILRPRAELWMPEKGRTQVLMMVGINGAGKTTTTGKLAARWKAEGFSMVLAAGDTFRAAAVEQLQGWGQRVQVPVVAQGMGADSASVVFDAFAAARARSADLLIADTAGRLHTQDHLMEELKKVKRVLAKQDPDAPHQVWLVLDAGTGQNALNQAQQFHEAIGLTGICITKLDGTAKGGVVAAIAKALPIPIRYIGVGEQVADLRPFDPESFVDALFAEPKS